MEIWKEHYGPKRQSIFFLRHGKQSKHNDAICSLQPTMFFFYTFGQRLVRIVRIDSDHN